MVKKPDTETGRWPVAVRDHDGKRVAPGKPATVTTEKAAEFDARFGRLPEAVPPAASREAAQKSE